MPGKYPLYLMEGEWLSRRRCEGGGESGRGAVRAGGTERTGGEHETAEAFLRNKANSPRAKGSHDGGTERPGKGHETAEAFLRNKANSPRAKGSHDGDTERPGKEHETPKRFCETKPIRRGPSGPTMATRPGPIQELMALAAVAGDCQGTTSGDASRRSRRWRTLARGGKEGTGKAHETVRAFLRNKANSPRPKRFSQDGDTAGAERGGTTAKQGWNGAPAPTPQSPGWGARPVNALLGQD